MAPTLATRRLAIGVAIIGLLVSACGDSDDDTAATVTEPATTSSTSAPTTTTTPTTATTTSTTTTAASSTTASSSTSTAVSTTCSAAGLTLPGDQAELPSAVSDRRSSILAAALDCDIEQLGSLTASEFTASFGGDDATTLWTDGEANGNEPLRFLVEILRIDYAVVGGGDEGTFYVWPRAFAYDSWDEVPEADREAISLLYTDEDFEGFRSFGGYIGYRVGIREDGTWTSFVAGD